MCSGNICRSPFAEVAARELAGGHIDRASSAGTFAAPGNHPTPTAVAAAAELGFDLTGHRARRLTAPLLAEAELVLGMEAEHVASVRALDPHARVELIDRECVSVADPYGGGLAEYRDCYEIIRAAVIDRFS